MEKIDIIKKVSEMSLLTRTYLNKIVNNRITDEESPFELALELKEELRKIQEKYDQKSNEMHPRDPEKIKNRREKIYSSKPRSSSLISFQTHPSRDSKFSNIKSRVRTGSPVVSMNYIAEKNLIRKLKDIYLGEQ